jgi:hypothetical protein
MALTLYRSHTSVKSFYSKHHRRELNRNCGLRVEHDGINWALGAKFVAIVAMMEQNHKNHDITSLPISNICGSL